MQVAFFDFDKTLISENSAKIWILNEWKLGKISNLQFLESSVWLFLYHLGIAKLDMGLKRAISMLKGKSHDDACKAMEVFYELHLKKLLRKQALACLADHRSKGHKLVLLTSAGEALADVVAKHLGFDATLCSRFQVDDKGIYTGEASGTPAFGPGKLTLADDYLKSMNSDFNSAYFYTDSCSDLPLLLRVKHPVCVTPDPLLIKEAKQRAWPILNWK